MIQLDLQNTLRNQLGWRHGLSEAWLAKQAQKNQVYVDEIFQRKNQEGYAFLSLPEQKKLVSQITRFTTEQKRRKWQNIVVLGIGGSALGITALKEALLHEFKQTPRLFVLDNVDPVFVSRTLDHLNFKETLFIVISKSGTTVEPMALYGIVRIQLEKEIPKDYAKHLVFITDPKEGLLRKIAKKDGIQTFDIPPKIGGRFSVLTAVGLVPAALAGLPISKLLKGAATMRARIQKTKGLANPALTLALVQQIMQKRKKRPMTVLMPYSNSLFRMGDWYRQLLAESLGKKPSVGPTPINALGSTDQHSQVQLYMEGPQDKWILFMTVKNFSQERTTGKNLPEEMAYLNQKKLSQILHAAHQGTREALAKAKRPNATLELDQINEESIGGLIMLFEFQIALLGLMEKVNAFDQPGVEEGKKIAKRLLSNSSTPA